MRIKYLPLIASLLLILCKQPNESKIVEEGFLYSIEHKVERMWLVSDYWSRTNYGFDAAFDTTDVYLSVENGGKNNSFLLAGAFPGVLSLYKISTAIGSSIQIQKDSTKLEIPHPTKPGYILFANRHTVTTTDASTGSESLKIAVRVITWDTTTHSYGFKSHDLSDLKRADELLFGYTDTTTFDDPITIDVKKYEKRELPDIKLFKLYGASVNVSTLYQNLNKVVSQAVDTVKSIMIDTSNRYIDKSWDLGGDGKFNPNDSLECLNVEDWAIAKGFYHPTRTSEVCILVLEQQFTDTTVSGLTRGNLCILPKNISSECREIIHEYLHCDNISDDASGTPIGLKDLAYDDENIMNFNPWFTGKRLRYREETKEKGGREKQWSSLTKTSY